MTVASGLSYAGCFVAGGIGGYVLGRAERRLQVGKSTRQRWADIARAVVGLALIGLIVFQQVRQSQRNDCLSAYFAAVSASIGERSAASGEQAAADRAVLVSQREFLLSVRAGAFDVEPIDLYIGAVDQSIAAIDQLETARVSAPLPQPPRCP